MNILFNFSYLTFTLLHLISSTSPVPLELLRATEGNWKYTNRTTHLWVFFQTNHVNTASTSLYLCKWKAPSGNLNLIRKLKNEIHNFTITWYVIKNHSANINITRTITAKVNYVDALPYLHNIQLHPPQ